MATRTEASIRAAVDADLDDITLIERAVFNDPWSRRSFADLVHQRHVLFLVATDENAILGYAVVLTAGDESELANLAVGRLMQRKGVGAKLLEESMAGARERGANKMFLEVRASNAAAIQLYSSAGFQAVGRRVRYYARPIEDAIVMKVVLK